MLYVRRQALSAHASHFRIELSGHVTTLISAVKCPLDFLVNFIITYGVKYGYVKVIKCPPSYTP